MQEEEFKVYNPDDEFKVYNPDDEFKPFNPETPSKFSSFLSGTRANFDKTFHGILQPLLESGYLGQRVSNASKEVAREREEDLKYHTQHNPFSTGLGEFTAEFGKGLPFYAAGGSVASALLPKIAPNLAKSIIGGGVGTILGRGAGTAIGEGILGGADYAHENESRLLNTLTRGIGGGVAGVGLGALEAFLHPAAKALIEAGKKSPAMISNLLKSFPKGGDKIIADNIAITDTNAAKKAASNIFNTVKTAAKQKGVDVEIPNLVPKDRALIRNTITDKEASVLEKFLDGDRRYGTTADLKKDLNRIISRLTKKDNVTPLTTIEKNALDKIKDFKSSLESNMEESLRSNGLTKEADMFKHVNDTYDTNVYTYTKNPVIQKYRKKELTAEDFVKELARHKKFKAKQGQKHPELYMRNNAKKNFGKYLNKAKTGVAVGAGVGLGVGGLSGLGYGAWKGYDLLKNHLSNKSNASKE